MAFTGVPSCLPWRVPSDRRQCRTRGTAPRVPCQVSVRAQLIGMPEGFGKSLQPDDNEVLLAELRFSDPDKLPGLVQDALPRLDESFYTFLEETIAKSDDIQERDTLRDLRDAITDIMKSLYEAAAAEQNASATDGVSPESRSATATGPVIDVSPGGGDVASASYDELIDRLVTSGAGPDLKVAVDMSYARIDMRLLERLSERIAAATAAEASALTAVRDAISAAMNDRMKAAMDSVKTVLAAGDPTAMRKQVDTLARKGRVDDAFVLLLQANLEQARKAGAEEAAKAIQMVLEQASMVKEVGLDPEIKLIRALLRTEDPAARVDMLMEGLKPRGAVTMMDGSATSGVKVDGKKFVTALRKLIEEFGNIDEKFVLKLSAIGEESEAVARKLFDMEDKDVQDLQDEAFHKRTVSIWDLEKIELEEEMQGRKAAWEGRLGEIPEGFDAEGKMQI